MFDDELEVCREATGVAQASVSPGKFKAKGLGWCRLTVQHGVSYGTFITASEQSRSLCVFGSGRYWVRADETRLVRLMVGV